MKRFTKFDGHLWHREGECAVEASVRPTADVLREKLSLCPECLALPDRDIPVLVDGFVGLGDTFYMKGAIRRLAKRGRHVYFKTPWPQLFWDSPEVRPVNPGKVGLRTQDANSSIWIGIWQVPPSVIYPITMSYHTADFKRGASVVEIFEAQAGVAGKTEADDYRTQAHPEWVRGWMQKLPRPLGIVHPPSVRREWANKARAPKPEYIQDIVNSRPDVFWVSVGWLKDKEEWLIGSKLKGVGLRLDHGELTTEELLGLTSVADVAVSSPCFMLPAAMSLGTPIFTVFGGYAPPKLLFNPLLADRVAHIAPDPVCACLKDAHDCDKWIGKDRVVEAFSRFMEARCRPR